MRKAEQLVNMLLELNVINTEELDALLKRTAARISNKPFRDWFMRVLRYNVINMDQLADAGVKLPPSFRHLIAFKEPGKFHEPEARTTLFNEPTRKEIEKVYEPYNPKRKQRAHDLPGLLPPSTPPEWAKKAGGRGEELYHFKRPQSQTDFVKRLENVADFLNTLSPDSPLGRRLKGMKVNDTDGFNEVWNEAQGIRSDIDEYPWRYQKGVSAETKEYRNLTLMPVVGTSPASVKRLQQLSQGTSWCTTGSHYAKQYLGQGPLYVVYKDNKPYVLIHPESNQFRTNENGVRQETVDDIVAEEIAPLFVGINLGKGLEGVELRAAVEEVPPETAAEVRSPEQELKLQSRKKKEPLPPWQEEPPRDTGYRPSNWE